MKKKILIFNLILITVALCVVFVAGISVNRNSHYEEAEQQVVTLTKVYASAYKGSTAESGTNIGVPDDVRLTIIDVGGKVHTAFYCRKTACMLSYTTVMFF